MNKESAELALRNALILAQGSEYRSTKRLQQIYVRLARYERITNPILYRTFDPQSIAKEDPDGQL